jgi:hypothetical protein
MPEEKHESIEELKKQLHSLQEKISSYEKEELPKFKVVELYSWEAPERVFIPRNKKWFLYLILLLLIIFVVILFLQEFIILVPVAAVGFVAYVLASVPPQTSQHKITNQGLNAGGHSYLWKELAEFWFTKENDETILHIATYLNFPRRIIMLIGNGDKEKIKEILLSHIPFREIPKRNWMDKVGDFLSEKFHKLTS